MAEKNTSIQENQCLAERLWLLYFNDYLHEKGIITESERNKMTTKIDGRKGSTSGKK